MNVRIKCIRVSWERKLFLACSKYSIITWTERRYDASAGTTAHLFDIIRSISVHVYSGLIISSFTIFCHVAVSIHLWQSCSGPSAVFGRYKTNFVVSRDSQLYWSHTRAIRCGRITVCTHLIINICNFYAIALVTFHVSYRYKSIRSTLPQKISSLIFWDSFEELQMILNSYIEMFDRFAIYEFCFFVFILIFRKKFLGFLWWFYGGGS
jgi:hypothetical protein